MSNIRKSYKESNKLGIGQRNKASQMHFSIPKMPDFLDDDKVEMVLTDESKEYFERARPKQGFVGIVELCPDERTNSGKQLAKIHLIPADNKESGALAGIDKEGKPFTTLSSMQRLGTFTGDLHVRAAGALKLGEKGGVNGMLMGFGIWKSGCGVKILEYLPPKEALIPNEYLLVKENGNWELYFTDYNYNSLNSAPEANTRSISNIPGLQEALDRLPKEKSLYSLTYQERVEIETLLRNTKEGKTEQEEGISLIKNRSTSQNAFSINREERNAQLYKVFFNIRVQFHSAHLTQLARELPLHVFEKIIKNTTQQLPGTSPIQNLTTHTNKSGMVQQITGGANGPRDHILIERQWMNMTQDERELYLLRHLIDLDKSEEIVYLIKTLYVDPNKLIDEDFRFASRADLEPMRNNKGNFISPFDYAIKHKKLNAAIALLENNPTQNYQLSDHVITSGEHKGDNFLTLAIKSGKPEIVKLILEKAPNAVNHVISEGSDKDDNALILAVKSAEIKMVELILEIAPHTADYVYPKDNPDLLEGFNVVTLFAIGFLQDYNILKLILEKVPHTAKQIIKNNQGIYAEHTNLMVAIASGEAHVVKLILEQVPHTFEEIDRVLKFTKANTKDPEIIKLVQDVHSKLSEKKDTRKKPLIQSENKENILLFSDEQMEDVRNKFSKGNYFSILAMIDRGQGKPPYSFTTEQQKELQEIFSKVIQGSGSGKEILRNSFQHFLDKLLINKPDSAGTEADRNKPGG